MNHDAHQRGKGQTDRQTDSDRQTDRQTHRQARHMHGFPMTAFQTNSETLMRCTNTVSIIIIISQDRGNVHGVNGRSASSNLSMFFCIGMYSTLQYAAIQIRQIWRDYFFTEATCPNALKGSPVAGSHLLLSTNVTPHQNKPKRSKTNPTNNGKLPE